VSETADRKGQSLLGRLNPARLPVRWRLTLASAGLTMAILLVFAAVIGNLTTQRVRDDFDRELETAANTLAGVIEVIETPGGTLLQGPATGDFALPEGASVRVYGSDRQLLYFSVGAFDLGAPRDGIHDVGDVRVATARLVSDTGAIAGFVQYGRSEHGVDATIQRLWLFLAAGVLGGTLLATLAGLAISRRALRPVASMTMRAREVADTRDPSRHMPGPSSDDEVGELARTLEEMLRSLDGARAERERAMQKQREFVADASHELRTPLTSILANLELLQASLAGRSQGEGEEAEMVDSALRSSNRMRRLVADLLLLARADVGRRGERRRCDLAEVARDAAAEVEPLAAGHRIEVVADAPSPVLANPDELHRMILNLLDNAVRHTPPGSRVQVRVRPDAAGDTVEVEVCDDGPGIPAEMRDKIFDRFVRRAGPGDTSGGSGTGLGLAIVRAVAGSHGGEVSVGAAELGGASFRIRLPLAPAAEDETAEARALGSL
jgi:signal transduction histidine kinase